MPYLPALGFRVRVEIRQSEADHPRGDARPMSQEAPVQDVVTLLDVTLERVESRHLPRMLARPGTVTGRAASDLRPRHRSHPQAREVEDDGQESAPPPVGRLGERKLDLRNRRGTHQQYGPGGRKECQVGPCGGGLDYLAALLGEELGDGGAKAPTAMTRSGSDIVVLAA